MRTDSLRGRAFPLLLIVFALGMHAIYAAFPPIVPAPKEIVAAEGELRLDAVRIDVASDGLERERAVLERLLADAGIAIEDEGVPVSIGLGDLQPPLRDSTYSDAIRLQVYRIEIDGDGVVVRGNSPQGVFYALQTLDQLLDSASLPHGTVVDWPDLDLRMLMVDPARQNENMDYYRRVIRFAARYKINAILVHLTDDQTSALYHEDYPELMHEHAWRPHEVRELVAFAEEHYIDLVPEIESLGHSRMFERRPNYRDYLHQTVSDTPDESWMGTDLPGFTNVLCPGSDHAVEYLRQMYRRTAELFPHAWIHIGFDEVDMTHCARCIEAFGEQTPVEWMTTALRQAVELASERERKSAIWGDMILQYPDVVENFAPEDFVVFDWYYRPDVTAESALFFKEKGFEVVATPALACAPHMVLPDKRNYDNIARFTAIAREHDLRGVNTTIWVPVRYMSDVLWTGIAYAAAHAWDGSAFDEADFFRAFMRDYFASDAGDAYHTAWQRLAAIEWYRPDYYTAGWIDEQTLEAARTVAERRSDEIRATMRELRDIRNELAAIGDTVRANWIEWRAIEDSAAILHFSMEHLLASQHLDERGETARLLEAKTRRLIDIIEADWDRNRFADDPGKDGRFLANQHLLFRFRQMHAFHQRLIEQAGE